MNTIKILINNKICTFYNCNDYSYNCFSIIGDKKEYITDKKKYLYYGYYKYDTYYDTLYLYKKKIYKLIYSEYISTYGGPIENVLEKINIEYKYIKFICKLEKI